MRLPAGLTEKEFRIIGLIGAGLRNEQVAEEASLSINSVKSYIRVAYQKIGVTERQGAIRWANAHGLGGPDRWK